jgi:diguanylate cyclase (GGDEF)-like protein
MPTNNQIDALTQVLRRDSLLDRLTESVALAGAAEAHFSILFIDLDHFKSINDAFGHLRGDVALAEVAARIKSTLRGEDLLFRYSGDEFVVIAAGANLMAATLLGSRMLRAVADQPIAGVPPVNCTLSIGVACFPEDGRDVNALLGCADQRSYAAKRGGRNRLVADTLQPLRPQWQSMRPRMIERDAELVRLRELVTGLVNGNNAHNAQQGNLIFNGARGAGLTRLIEEADIFAKQLGLRVLRISGEVDWQQNGQQKSRSADQITPYSTLERSYQRRGGDAFSLDAAIDRVRVWCRDASAGLLLIDDWQQVDAETKNLIATLFAERALLIKQLTTSSIDDTQVHGTQVHDTQVQTIGTVLTVAHAINHRHRQHYPEWLQSSHVSDCDLAALTRTGFDIFVHSVFAVPMDSAFRTWVYDASSGLPGLAMRILLAMSEQGLIRIEQDAAVVSPDFRKFNLSAIRGEDVPHNLAHTQLGLIGRNDAIEAVSLMLAQHRLVNILGTGGIGKSSLALQVAMDTRFRFKDGAWFIELAQVIDRQMLVFAITKVLAINLNASMSPVAALVHALAKSEMLLVLDNLEQVVGEAEIVIRQLLVACPALTILTTSRVRLTVDASLEAEYMVPLLIPSADAADAQGAELKKMTAAATLFVERAKSAQRKFELTPEKLQMIEHICQKLDGLPLAIELAAARLRTLPLIEIANRLDDRLNLLGRATRTYQHSLNENIDQASARMLHDAAYAAGAIGHPQRTLRESIALSVQLLTDTEATTFAELSVMGGQFDVSTVNGLIGRRVEDDIATLADASLLNEKLINDVPTFLMLETLREFGQARLQEEGRWTYMKSRHLRYVSKIAAIGRTEPVGEALQHWRGQMDRLSGDMREALSWAISSGAKQDFQSGLAAFGDSQSWWELSGRWLESITWWARLMPEIQRASQSVALSSAMVHAARANFMLARYDECEHLYQDALQMANSVGDMQSAATALTGLGNHANFRGQTADAQTFYTQALHRYRNLAENQPNLGFSARVAYCLNTLGLIARQAGEFEQQLSLYREAAELRQTIGDEFGLAQSNMCLGTGYNDIGKPQLALTYFERARVVLRRFSESRFLSMSLSQEIVSHTLLNEPARGLKNVPEIFALARNAHDRRRCLFTLAVAVAPLRLLGNHALAVSISSATYALSEREAITLLTPELAMMQRDREALRGAINEAAYRQAMRQGVAWTLEEAMAALQSAIDALP